jgi:PST family polysaccharide transporter
VNDTSQTTSRRFLGTLVLTLGNSAKILIQLALVPILARSLSPAEFGLVALVMPVIMFVNLFADAGMEKALARETEPSEAMISTAYWLSGLIGLGLVLVIWALGKGASFLHLPENTHLLLVALAPIVVLSALCTVPNALIIQKERLSAFALADMSSALISGVVAVTLVLNGFGVWSLVIQQLVLWSVRLVIITTMAQFRPRLIWEPQLLVKHMGFAAQSMGVNITDFLGRNIDNMLIGLLLGAAPLGLYAMSYQVMRLPEMLISGPVYLALFSMLSKNFVEQKPIAATYLSALRVVVQLVTPLLVGVSLIADLLVPVVIGPKWLEAVPVLTALAPAGIVFCISAVNAATLMSTGRPGIHLQNEVFRAVILIIGIGVGSLWKTPTAVAFGVTIAAGLAILPGIARASHAAGTTLVAAAKALAAPAIGAAGMVAVTLALRPLLSGLPGLAEGAVLIGVNAAVYVALVLVSNRKAAITDLAMLRSLTQVRSARSEGQ